MDVEGFTPAASALYLTMRQSLADSLTMNIERKQPLPTTKSVDPLLLGSYPFKRGPQVTNVMKDREVKRGLVDLSLERMDMLFLDDFQDDSHHTQMKEATPKQTAPHSNGIMEGLKFLSGQRCMAAIRENRELVAVLDEPRRRYKPLKGRIQDMIDMLNTEGAVKGSRYMSKNIAIGPDGNEAYVGPLTAKEVAHLLILAHTLQVTSTRDETLKKNVENFSVMWKKAGKVPNTVAKAIVTEIYEGRLHQCSACALRLKTMDMRNRHMLSHEQRRREVLWGSMNSWVKTPTRRPAVRAGQRAPVVLLTIHQMLDKERLAEPYGIKWLREALFLRSGMKECMDVTTDRNAVSHPIFSVNEGNPLIENETKFSLWSWGIMDDCRVIPTLSDGRACNPKEEECDPHLLQEMCHKVRFNVTRCAANLPLPISYSNNSRNTCVLCHDPLQVEFDVDYNALVYRNTVCFVMDQEYIEKCFNGEQVSLDMLVGTEGLRHIKSHFSVLRKIACLKLVKSKLICKKDVEYKDWSITQERSILDENNVIPEMKCITQDQKLLTKELILAWRGPFTLCNDTDTLPTALLYAHTQCMKAVMNAHILRAKQLGSFAPCDIELDALKWI
ncbi:hypothetical protein BgAZ_500320 [Babesia gibsoni]|uniref:C2H2-type domain-containing protein n=1 Tax=Babesia gibsoni TaxID=33632 RepID=A0AAD8LQK3_BABGI|nr:hypothetical protein BgAZ_500320 [Babesia gibsoni]